MRRWVRRFLREGRPNETGALLMTLTAAIHESLAYTRRTEPGTQDPVLTWRLGHGSCRDLALLMIEAVRELGMAARFASDFTCRAAMARPSEVAGPPMLGAKYICRALAGLSSIRPTASSAATT